MKLTKYILFIIFLGPSATVQATCLDTAGYLREGDPSLAGLETCNGQYAEVTARDAQKICPADQRLPTMLELARIPVQFGSRCNGFISVEGNHPSERRQEVERYLGGPPSIAGYVLISANNADGTKDEFYFNPRLCYLPQPVGLWTSSVEALSGRIFFSTKEGHFGSSDLQWREFKGVRCVPSR